MKSHRRSTPGFRIADEPDAPDDASPELRALSFRPLPADADRAPADDATRAPADEPNAGPDTGAPELGDEDPATLAWAPARSDPLSTPESSRARALPRIIAVAALAIAAELVLVLAHHGAPPRPVAPPVPVHAAPRVGHARPAAAHAHRVRRARPQRRHRRLAPAARAAGQRSLATGPTLPGRAIARSAPALAAPAMSAVEREFGFEGHS